MKKLIKIIAIIIVCLIAIKVNATANKQYNIGDYVYFDPVSNKSCTYSNYWTTINKDTTCYRFLVIQNSNSPSSNVKLLLDHNIANVTFDKLIETLKNVKNSWTRFNGNVDTLSETELMSLIKISIPPKIGESYHYKLSDGTSGAAFEQLKVNNVYYVNGIKKNEGGFWTKTIYENDSNYAYLLTENANNKLVEVTKKRGVRPVITIDKSLVNDDKEKVNLNIELYKQYKHLTEKFDGHTHKQMQGFTFANDKLFFYSSNGANPNNGILFGYGGNEYSTSIGYIYDAMGHGNDMTYNSNTNKIYLVGPNGYKSIWIYDPLSFTKGATQKIDVNKLGILPSGIAYNSKDDNYFFRGSGEIVVSTDKTFSKLITSFPVAHTETKQGIEFYKGYIYVTSFELGTGTCPNKYQLYCYDKEYTGAIYVYNAKYNEDGTPSPNYGRLVARYYFPTGFGELETLSFKSDVMYLGVAAQYYAKDMYTYKIYKSNTNVLQSPTYSVTYKNGYIEITSPEDLQKVDGWTLSSNNKKLTKKQTESESNVKICDRYNNCKEQALKKLDTITFNDIKRTYTGSVIKTENAIAKSNSSIKYEYYSNENCTQKIDSIINTGNYFVKATSSGNATYTSNSKCVKLTVSKSTPIIEIPKKETIYTGNKIVLNTPTATIPNSKTKLTLTYTYNYYSNSTCTKKISYLPINVGNYYVKAISNETSNLNSASSDCTLVKINKANPIFNIQSSVNMEMGKTVLVSYNTNSTGSVTCTSSDIEKVVCKIENGKVVLTSKKEGKATIIITQNENSNFNKKDNIQLAVNVLDEVQDTNKPIVEIKIIDDNININIIDNETYILGNQTVYYAITNSNTERPSYNKKINLTNDNEATKTILIPSSNIENLDGTYYVWVKGGIKDSNNNQTVETVSKAFNFKPELVVTGNAIKSKTKIKGTITIKSVLNIKKQVYNFGFDTLKEFTGSTFITDMVDFDKVYIYVTDESNQTKKIEINIEEEEQPILELYVLDSQGRVLNNIVDSENKELIYRIKVYVPKSDKITQKYTKFEIKNIIDDNLEINKDTIKIHDSYNNDIKKKFNVSFNDNEKKIIPKDITNNDFYEKNYNIEIKTRIKKNYNPTKDNKTLISKTELILDDTHKEVIPIESSIEYHQVKSSLIEHIIQKNENIIYLIISLLAILIVIYLVNK